MSALIHPYCGPLAERQIEIQWDVGSVRTFEDGGTPELARRLLGNPIYVLSPTSPHAGYGIYSNNLDNFNLSPAPNVDSSVKLVIVHGQVERIGRG